MKLSWTSLKISIAGAKLSHLAQKDRIWDHGSMAEQARIIFYLVHKARANRSVETLKKQCTASCFDKFKHEIEKREVKKLKNNPVINELAIVQVKEGKHNRPDTFSALIKGYAGGKDNKVEKFSGQWNFIRQGDRWLLSEIKK